MYVHLYFPWLKLGVTNPSLVTQSDKGWRQLKFKQIFCLRSALNVYFLLLLLEIYSHMPIDPSNSHLDKAAT